MPVRVLGLLLVLLPLLCRAQAPAQQDLQWLSVDDGRLGWLNAAAWEPREGGLQPVRVAKAWRDQWPQANERARTMSGAGVAVRFRTDSRKIVFRAVLVNNPVTANTPEEAWELARPPYFSVYRDGRYVSSIAGKVQAARQDVVVMDLGAQSKEPAEVHEYKVLLPFYYRNGETILYGIGVGASAKVEAAPPDPRPRVFFYGDSITHGHGVTAPHETYIWQSCEKASCVSLNFGFGGTAWGEKIVAETIADRGDWDVLVIAIGTNSFRGIDGATGQKETAAQYGQKYGVFIDTIRAKWPDKPIVAMTPILNRFDIQLTRNANGELAQAYRDAISRAVRDRQARDQNLHLVHGLQFVNDPQQLWVTDLVHPTDAGSNRMAEGLAAELIPVLKK